MQQIRYVVKKSPMFYFEKEKLFRPMIITHDNLHVWPCLEPGASTAISRHQVLRRGLRGEASVPHQACQGQTELLPGRRRQEREGQEGQEGNTHSHSQGLFRT